MTSRTRIALLVAATALVATLAVAAILAGPSGTGSRTGSSNGASESESGFEGGALPPGVKAHPFTLTAVASPSGAASIGGGSSSSSSDGSGSGSADGSSGGGVSLGQFAGKVVVMAFLYPGCGHTCTLIADQIRGALNELAEVPVVLIVSATQKAGTHARADGLLEETSLAGRAYYLTGSPRLLRALWRAYGIVPASAGRSKFDAYAEVLLIDGKGNERVLFGTEDLTAEGLAHDIGRLQAGA
jgi:protein SCO1